MVTIGSLCSGYGGLDMGLQSVIGGEVLWHFEYDKAPSKILAHHYPDIPNHGDITKTDWDIPAVDWLTAGYPCQPFSEAGKRKGVNDARHIWPHIADAICLLRPNNVLLENVAGHLSLGFGQVLGDLAGLGYDARWVCVRAGDAGAPHGRKRIFVVANARGDKQRKSAKRWIWPKFGHGVATTSDTDSAGRGFGTLPRLWRRSEARIELFGLYGTAIRRWERITGHDCPDPLDGDKLRAEFVEWMMGLTPGHVTAVKIGRHAKLKALGNGVVPQQAALALRLMGVGQ